MQKDIKGMMLKKIRGEYFLSKIIRELNISP